MVTNLYHLFDSDCVAGNNQEVSVILAETLKFEVAYCHNCNNDYHKTLDYLDTVAQPGLNHIELRPKVLYKLEQFEKCLSACGDIMRPGQSFGSQKNVL